MQILVEGTWLLAPPGILRHQCGNEDITILLVLIVLTHTQKIQEQLCRVNCKSVEMFNKGARVSEFVFIPLPHPVIICNII